MVKVLNTKDDFEKELIGNELVVVDFFATWCFPCMMASPILDKLSKEFSEVKFLKIDVDNKNMRNVVKEYGVRAMPTFKFFKNGKVQETVRGLDIDSLKKNIEKFK